MASRSRSPKSSRGSKNSTMSNLSPTTKAQYKKALRKKLAVRPLPRTSASFAAPLATQYTQAARAASAQASALRKAAERKTAESRMLHQRASDVKKRARTRGPGPSRPRLADVMRQIAIMEQSRFKRKLGPVTN